MRLLLSLSAVVLMAFPSLAAAQSVLKTQSGICHCPGGSHYDKIKRAEAFPDIAACLATGAREPKSGQGNCAATGMNAAPTAAAPAPQQSYATATAGPKYEREAFGDGWLDFDGNCMNTRHEVLAQTSTGAVAASRDGCAVTRGRWNDPYTGKIFTNPRDMDIDHIVPLSFAWQHGADGWTEEKRRAFANDPINLIAVDASTNRQKSDSGPLKWLPPNVDYRCEYILRFTRISIQYGLEFPAQEAQDMDDLSGHLCG